MSRAVRQEGFGGTDVLDLVERTTPEPGPSQIRIRVLVAGLNPVDWQIVASAELASYFGVTPPTGFGNDFAGVIDAVGPGVTGWEVGERVFGGARAAAVADHLVVAANDQRIHRTPDGVDDLTAGVLDIAGRTASAVADVLALEPTDTVLIGAAGGGVGSILSQLAARTGARVLGTGSPESTDHLRRLGVEPITYGPGLVDRVRAVAPAGVTAAADLFGTQTAEAAIELGASPHRVVTIEADNPPAGTRPVNGSAARQPALRELLELVRSGQLRIPVQATYELPEFRKAVERQQSRHTRGKIAIVTS
jgi:NADPH:quinone reductase-like Zn-dependent oxidoreductase